MRVDRVLPCVCSPNYDDGHIDDIYYGMPKIKVANGISKGKQFFEICCPKCGRGGMKQFSSIYYALKWWNELQTGLREEVIEWL